ncbi:hypothetical protein [Thermospira aquatica]|uniref:Uncharacterized protein n=1 Tax=Thermospira aquatica TaxID=2828656 RepID=A0AAX3BEC1_9SPIR|nr:hypothetical protein [Thermospira aquatica]URA10580.1 hypothetical protein KDW03_01905 [Thermospira aquatica]
MKYFMIIILILGLTYCGNSQRMKGIYSEALKEKASNEVEWAIVKWNDSGEYYSSGEYSFNEYTNMIFGNGILFAQTSKSELQRYNYKEIEKRMDKLPAEGVRKAFDKNTNTYWEFDKSDYILMDIWCYGPFKNHKDHQIVRIDGAPYRMEIWSGNPSDFKGYSRPKVITLEIYETGVFEGVQRKVIPQNTKDIDDILQGVVSATLSNGNYYVAENLSYVTNRSLLLYRKDFTLEDKPGYQAVELDFPNLAKVYGEDEEAVDGIIGRGGKIARIVVKEVYPGAKSKNVCITEIRFVYE